MELKSRLPFHLWHESLFVVVVPCLLLLFALGLAFGSVRLLFFLPLACIARVGSDGWANWILFLPLWALVVVLLTSSLSMFRHRKVGLDQIAVDCSDLSVSLRFAARTGSQPQRVQLVPRACVPVDCARPLVLLHDSARRCPRNALF